VDEEFKIRMTWYPTRMEPFVYTITERLTEDYNGGFWERTSAAITTTACGSS